MQHKVRSNFRQHMKNDTLFEMKWEKTKVCRSFIPLFHSLFIDFIFPFPSSLPKSVDAINFDVYKKNCSFTNKENLILRSE